MILGVIPARMGSSRFPGKPLARLNGKPMIEHVYERSARCRVLDRVVVATPDEAIAEAVRGFGGDAVMTASSHVRATDRVAEAAQLIGGDLVVMIQGDEPMVQPDMIEAAIAPVAQDAEIFCTNLIESITAVEEFTDPHTIKVVTDKRGNALFFSPEPIPNVAHQGFAGIRAYKQVCVIAFRRNQLQVFTTLKPTPLEQAESIDMLRVLEHGYTIRLVETPYRTHAVDTPEDLELVEHAMAVHPVAQVP